jgi:hypothetical protein
MVLLRQVVPPVRENLHFGTETADAVPRDAPSPQEPMCRIDPLLPVFHHIDNAAASLVERHGICIYLAPGWVNKDEAHRRAPRHMLVTHRSQRRDEPFGVRKSDDEIEVIVLAHFLFQERIDAPASVVDAACLKDFKEAHYLNSLHWCAWKALAVWPSSRLHHVLKRSRLHRHLLLMCDEGIDLACPPEPVIRLLARRSFSPKGVDVDHRQSAIPLCRDFDLHDPPPVMDQLVSLKEVFDAMSPACSIEPAISSRQSTGSTDV